MMRSKTNITATFVFALFFACFNLHAETDQSQNRIISLKLVSVSYTEAFVDLEYFHNSEETNNLYIRGFIPEVQAGYRPHIVKQGLNHIRLVISRDEKKHKPVTTKNISIAVYFGGRNINWEENVELEIHWPGPEYVQEVIGGETAETHNDTSIQKIRLNREITGHAEIYKALLKQGIPIHKIDMFGSREAQIKGLSVIIGKHIEPEVAQRITSIALSKSDSISNVLITGEDDRFFRYNDILIGGYSGVEHAQLSEGNLNKLKSTELSTKDFYTILGKKLKTNDEIIEDWYNTAYKLIDTGQRDNINRAKVLLNKIIEKNPNFPRAYLELARYHMKNSGSLTSETLEKAERSILIAKEIDPELADTRVLLGYVYTHQ